MRDDPKLRCKTVSSISAFYRNAADPPKFDIHWALPDAPHTRPRRTVIGIGQRSFEILMRASTNSIAEHIVRSLAHGRFQLPGP